MVKPASESSLSEFLREADSHLERLAQSGQPQVLTVDGEARVVVQDVRAYQRLLDALDLAESIAGIRRGLESKARGEGVPMRDAIRSLGREYGIDLDDHA